MAKAVEKAIEKISLLPGEDQESIARGLLSHIEKLRQLRNEIDKGLRPLDAGQGGELDVEDFIHARRYGTA
jgi:hypothetical protein